MTDAQWGAGALLGAALLAALGSLGVAALNRRTMRVMEKDASPPATPLTSGELLRELYRQGLLTQQQLGELKARVELLTTSVSKHHRSVGHADTLRLILALVEAEHGPEAKELARKAIEEMRGTDPVEKRGPEL